MADDREAGAALDPRGLITATRDEIVARERAASATEEAAAAREARATRVTRVGLAVALTLGALSLGASWYVGTTLAEETAAVLAPRVAAEQVRDARETRAVNARRILDAANRNLDERGLPVVEVEDPAANADQLQAAANYAQTLALLPEEITVDIPGDEPVTVAPLTDGTIGPVEPPPG